MTKPLNPEIKAMKALVRTAYHLDFAAQRRILDWYASRLRSEELKAAEQQEGETDG